MCVKHRMGICKIRVKFNKGTKSATAFRRTDCIDAVYAKYVLPNSAFVKHRYWGGTGDMVLRAVNNLRWHKFEGNVKIGFLDKENVLYITDFL